MLLLGSKYARLQLLYNWTVHSLSLVKNSSFTFIFLQHFKLLYLFFVLLFLMKSVLSVYFVLSDSVWDLLFRYCLSCIVIYLDLHLSYFPFLVHSRLFYSHDSCLKFWKILSYYLFGIALFFIADVILQFIFYLPHFLTCKLFSLYLSLFAFLEICFALQFTNSFSSYTNANI